MQFTANFLTKFFFRSQSRYLFSKSSLEKDFIDIGALQKPKGKLTICPTPIGNLHDWSLRQDKALFDADVIACEDTRTTGMLIRMLKTKNIRDQLYGHYDLPATLNEENDLDDDDFDTQKIVFSTTKELEAKLPKLNDQFITETDVKLHKQRKIDEMHQRIDQMKKQQEETLNKMDPLNFLNNEQTEEFDLYGISAPFFTYLKNKIESVRKRKGRGILISCHKFNEQQRVNRLVSLLRMGFNVTLVSDAGTPCLSDPGYILVDKCIQGGVDVFSIPGPSAISLSLSLSGFPSDNYQFVGFSSKQLNNREDSLLEARKIGKTVVLFESPHRLTQLLLSIEKIYGDGQQVWIGFELTKLFEHKLRGPVRQLFDDITNPKVVKQSHLKGEVTLVIAPYIDQYNENLKSKRMLAEQEVIKDDEDDNTPSSELIRKVSADKLAQVLSNNLPDSKDKEIISILIQSMGISKTKAYNAVKLVKYQKQLDEKNQKLRERLGIQLD